ncbi:hypothetical protein Tco_0842151 [Tanacetum coccineum]|uniref:Uncharacterized protein n=1 Tax=Tanacetum coccineum TaxID=301880 RepID=A0ABQ5B443_9ASTR
MISGTNLHQFDVYNDGYFVHLPLTYVDGVILEIVVPRTPYEQLPEFLEEKSTSYMFDVEETFGRLTLYLNHLDMNLSEYLSQAITYEMDDMVEMEVETKGVEARTSTTDGVESRNSTTEGVEARTIDSETKYENDDDSDYQSDKSVDYLSPFKDELNELINRMKANRKAKAKAKDKPDEEMNEPNEENSMPVDNVRGETFEEHDIYMNELLKSLKTAGKDGITKDPFIYVEKHVERYPMYDETTHWRLRRPKVGEKYTSVAQFKECLTYYALANGFSLWHERKYEKIISEHYSMLRSYGKAILDSNPRSTVKLRVTVNPDGKTYFDSGGVESRVRESDGGDRIDREMGRIFGVGRKSSPENFSGGCGGGRRLPDIFGREKDGKISVLSHSFPLKKLCPQSFGCNLAEGAECGEFVTGIFFCIWFQAPRFFNEIQFVVNLESHPMV